MPVLRPAIPAILRPPTWPYQLVDNFSGSEALADHLPDLNRQAPNTGWTIGNGAFNSLSGGYVPGETTNYSKAVQDVGAYDIIVECYCKAITGAATGPVLRCDASGNHWAVDMSPSGASLIRYTTWSTYAGGPAKIYTLSTPTIASGNYYKIKVVAYKNTYILYVDDVAAKYAVDTSNYYITETRCGIGCTTKSASHSYDWITVKAIDTSKIRRIAILGDSMSNDVGEWPTYVAYQYKDAMGYICENNAQVGATVQTALTGQTDNTADADADIILIELGTNDSMAYDPESNYATHLGELGASNKRSRIFAMSIFPTTGLDEAQRAHFNGHIAAAVATEKAAGVNVDYWDTDGWIDPGPRPWVASTAYALDALVRPTTLNGYYYKATVGGTSGGTEPTWPTVIDETVVDGTVTWKCYAVDNFDTSDGRHPNAQGHAKIATQVLARLP